MASTDTPVPVPEKEAPPPEAAAPALELEKSEPPPPAAAPLVAEPEKSAPPPETKAAEPAPPPDYYVVADVVLRVVLFAAAVTAVVVIVTSDQTKVVTLPVPPFPAVARPAKFSHSPAFIYFVAALSVAGLYSVATAAVSFLAILKPGRSTVLLPHFIIFDVIILGIVAAASGAAGGVAYIGLKGNSHVGWTKVCNIYDKFCQHLGASVGVSIFASVVLAALVILSALSLSKKIPK